tara:strand:- start:1944 stop:2402 length:459 start_codon:yes stop_codon:yes gene_type:complete
LAKKDNEFIDYKNPGLNEQGGKNLKFIAEKSEFFKLTSDDEEKGILRYVDIFRLAVAVAVARDLKLPKKVKPTGSDPVERPNGKSWTQATLDMPSAKKGEKKISLSDMVTTLCDDPIAQETPWAYIELLAHAGLEELVKDIKAKKMLSEIIE